MLLTLVFSSMRAWQILSLGGDFKVSNVVCFHIECHIASYLYV